MDRYCSGDEVLDILFFVKAIILDITKRVLLSLEPKLLVMLGRIGEALQKVCECCK
jgi:hypothetical protein